jgi:hypothetical protein
MQQLKAVPAAVQDVAAPEQDHPVQQTAAVHLLVNMKEQMLPQDRKLLKV